jgi:hypothetical protein
MSVILQHEKRELQYLLTLKMSELDDLQTIESLRSFGLLELDPRLVSSPDPLMWWKQHCPERLFNSVGFPGL